MRVRAGVVVSFGLVVPKTWVQFPRPDYHFSFNSNIDTPGVSLGLRTVNSESSRSRIVVFRSCSVPAGLETFRTTPSMPEAFTLHSVNGHLLYQVDERLTRTALRLFHRSLSHETPFHTP